MPENFISLKCQSCGGKLDVYEDMERFACGYCGTEMIVQRRGGTVALKLVQEAIKQLQIGTDKTAAELALVRLGDELKVLKGAFDKISKTDTPKLLGFVNGILLLIAGVILLLSSSIQLGVWTIIIGGFVTWLCWL